MTLRQEDVQAAYEAGAAEYERTWLVGEIYPTSYWIRGMASALGLPLGEERLARLQEALESVAASDPPPMMKGARDMVLDLHAAGRPLGIVSDTGLTVGRVMRVILEQQGILHCFSGLAFSDEVGAVKPAAAPYLRAMEGMGTVPERTVHVGDLPHTDIIGAKALGMRAVQITGHTKVYDLEGRADAVVEDYAGLWRVFQEWGLLPAG